MDQLINALKSKTVWGAIIVQGAGLVGLGHISPTDIAHAIGIVVGVAGGRHALDKVADVVAASKSDGGAV